jgi:stress response protein YsnF
MSAEDPGAPSGDADAEHVVPVSREEVEVTKREVETARVRVEKRIVEREHAVEATLRREQVDVERVAKDEEVEGPLPPREEGDCLVIPVVEEYLVVQKRWKLTGEVRIRRRATQHAHQEHMTLRAEDVRIVRGVPRTAE